MAGPGSISSTLDAITSASAAAAAAINTMSENVKGSKDVLGGLIGVSNSVTKSFDGITASLAGIVKGIPVLGDLAEGLATVGSATLIPVKALTSFAEVYNDLIKVGDGFTSVIRDTDKAMYDLASSFGSSFSEAQIFRNQIIDISQAVSGLDFGYISPKELIDTMKVFSDSGITIDKFSDTISNSAGKFDLLTAAIIHSQAIGMTTQEYLSHMSNAMMKQGLSSQEAGEQLQLYSDISKDTGLNTDKVAGALQGLSDGFTSMGLSANFGEPLLRGFANTLSGMGLGIENAISLTTSLGTSLANLTTNYSTAYLTFNRGGGLNFGQGSGSALGAGIQFQSKLLKAQQSGDASEQASLAKEMAGMMRDTLASFTGGSIVTLSQAAENPALEATYYAQTKLLEQMYQISAKDSPRVLEMLTNINNTSASGSKELSDAMGVSMDSSIGARDDTLSNQQKLDAELSSNTFDLNKTNEDLINTIKEQGQTSAEHLAGITTDIQEAITKAFGSEIVSGLTKAQGVTADKLGTVTEALASMFTGIADSKIDDDTGSGTPSSNPNGTGSFWANLTTTLVDSIEKGNAKNNVMLADIITRLDVLKSHD